jgi:hypothetical protein
MYLPIALFETPLKIAVVELNGRTSFQRWGGEKGTRPIDEIYADRERTQTCKKGTAAAATRVVPS